MITEEQTKKKRRTVHSISFKDEDLKIIKLAAQQEGISFASFLKHATLEYIKESLEYQRLVDSGEMSKQQNAVPEAFSTFEETINNTLLSMYESINKRLKKIEWLAENGIYYQFYFHPSTTEEEREGKSKLANERMMMLEDRIKKEIRSEKEK